VLFVDDDQPQRRQRREQRQAGAEHDRGLAARGLEPGAGARDVFEAAVQHR